MTDVAGVLDVRKPYFNADPGRIYRNLGTVAHRGVELSLTARPVEGLSVIAGIVLLDAEVSGEVVDFGIIGPRPVGISPRTIRANFDYRLPFLDSVSVDLGVTHEAGKPASTVEFAELGGRQLETEASMIKDIGTRCRFAAGFTPLTLRAQITNLFDVLAWDVGSNSAFTFNNARRFQLSLAADF